MIPNSQKNNIFSAVLNGFSWNLAGSITRSLSGFVINILLARLLGPEPFGLVAMAMIVISIGTLIIESGLTTALIQQKEINNDDISFIFTVQISLSLVLASIIVIFAPWLAIFFSSPAVTLVLQALAFYLMIQSFAQVPTALLRRQLNFKRLQQSQIISYLAGYLGVGLPLAYFGWGVWSLIFAQITQAFINAGIVFLSAKHAIIINIKGSKQLAYFGIKILGANIANWIIQNVDNTIIGRQFGTNLLGLYSRAYFLSYTPTGTVMSSAQIAIFSSVSRTGKGGETIKIFLSFFSAFSIFLIPIYAALALGANDIILVVYGQDWLPAANFLVPLAVAMPFYALMGLEGPVLNGLGDPGIEARVQWITTALALIILLISSQISLMVTVWGVTAIYLIRFLIMTSQATKVLDLSWLRIAKTILPGILLAGVISAVWILASLGLNQVNSTLFTLLIKAFLVLLAWLVTVYLGRKSLFSEISSVITQLKSSR